MLRCSSLSLALALAACRPASPAAPPQRPRIAHDAATPAAAPRDASTSSDASTAPDGSASAGPADARRWPFLDHARRWCLADRLGTTEYLLKWAPLFHGHAPPGDPLWLTDRYLPRATGEEPPTFEDQQRLLTWQAFPRVSHVMDCTLPVADTSRADRPLRTATYAIYLPADYLDHPERPRPVLLLVSGGNGNRTRWFLTPSSDRGVVPGTGGLSVRTRVDAWIAAHPDATPPIVIGLDGSSAQFPNGMWMYLARELPEHLFATYLPGHSRDTVALGVGSISSGAVEVARALKLDPAVFHVIGFWSPFVHPDGIALDSTMGTVPQRDRLFRTLGERRRDGLLAMRFSIGDKDDHYARTWEWYRLLARAGVFPEPREPRFERCQRADWRPGPGHCWRVWEGFFLMPGEFHNYHALLPSFAPQFEWSLESLAEIQGRLDARPR